MLLWCPFELSRSWFEALPKVAIKSLIKMPMRTTTTGVMPASKNGGVPPLPLPGAFPDCLRSADGAVLDHLGGYEFLQDNEDRVAEIAGEPCATAPDLAPPLATEETGSASPAGVRPPASVTISSGNDGLRPATPEDSFALASARSLLDERDVAKRFELASKIGWTLNSGGIPIPPPERSGVLSTEQADFVWRLGQRPPEQGSEAWCEKLMGCLLRTKEGVVLVGKQGSAPSPGCGQIYPADFNAVSHGQVMSAAAVCLMRARNVTTISRTEIEEVLRGLLAANVEDAAAVASKHGPAIFDLLARIYEGEPSQLGSFLREVTPPRRQSSRERKTAARARGPLESWLIGQRMQAINRTRPAGMKENGYLEDIAALATLRIGSVGNVVLFDFDQPPPAAKPRLWLREWVIGKPGNLVTIQGPPKAGKSAVIESLIATTQNPPPEADCLGFRATNPQGLPVLHFDTEQDQDDHHAQVQRALRRAGAVKPQRLKSYWIRELPVRERLAFIQRAMEEAHLEFDGILMVFIDGVADLCSNVNDPEEALPLVHELLRLSSEYQTVLVSVLHENPGTETGKTRGHLGSELERKSMSNLRLQKEASGVVTIWGEKMRKCEIPKSLGPRFKWNASAGMHLTFDGEVEKGDDVGTKRLRNLALQAFAGQHELPYAAVLEKMGAIEMVGDRTAKTRFKAMKASGMLSQASAVKGSPWRLGPAAICPARAELALKSLAALRRTVDLSSWLLTLPEEAGFTNVELKAVVGYLVAEGRAVHEPGQGWRAAEVKHL